MSNAARKLEREAHGLDNDPVWQAALQAPSDPEETEEERQLADEARRGSFTSALSPELFPPHPHNTGTYVLTPEEADELEEACLETDEDEKAGRLVSHEEVLAALFGA